MPPCINEIHLVWLFLFINSHWQLPEVRIRGTYREISSMGLLIMLLDGQKSSWFGQFPIKILRDPGNAIFTSIP